jgi:hypothetical protein
MMIQHLADLITTTAGHVLALAPGDPSTAPGVPGAPAPKAFTGSGILKLLLIALQIGGAALGVFFIFRAKKGDLSATMSSGAVFLVGLAVFAGSSTLLLLSLTTGLLDFMN